MPSGRSQPADPSAGLGPARRRGTRSVRLGFVPLIDAAPIIVAVAHGHLAAEGIDATLEKQLGWGNVRDKLAFGHLDASHALLGLPLDSFARRDDAAAGTGGQPFVAVMPLGTGGDAITLSRRLTRANVRTPAMLLEHVRRNLSPSDPRPVFGYVFRSSVHQYLLRAWLASGGLDPDRDVRLCVLPPPQMADHMAAGHLDGFCVGEPWNTQARINGSGEIVALTTDAAPDHPDKVLAVRGSLARSEPDVVIRIARAVARAARWCEDGSNQNALIALLASPDHLDLDAGLIRQSLTIERHVSTGRATHGPDRRGRSFTVGDAAALHGHIEWLAGQMIRWGHLPAGVDVAALASQCAPTEFLAEALRTLGLTTPDLELTHV